MSFLDDDDYYGLRDMWECQPCISDVMHVSLHFPFLCSSSVYTYSRDEIWNIGCFLVGASSLMMRRNGRGLNKIKIDERRLIRWRTFENHGFF